MKEYKEALLQLPYGRRSLSYLLHEDKLRACGLLEQDQSIDDTAYRKYTKWDVLRSFSNSGWPAKVPKKTEVTPPPPAPIVPSSGPHSEVDIPAADALPLPPAIKILPTLGPAPKKPAITKGHLLSISTHSYEYVIENAAETHRATLGSDVLSWVGQSFSRLGAPQWQFLVNAQNSNVLYDKCTEHISSALAVVAQLNYKLNNEVHASMYNAQESKDLQLKLTDEFKTAKLKLEAELEKLKAELKEKSSRVEELEKLDAKLEEEKKATFEIIEGEKARLLEEFKQRKDRAVDMAMYRIWANDVDLNTSFLGSFEDEFLEKWQAQLEAEEAAREDAEKAKEGSPTS
ncbi:uncharacterized protein LOC133832351 [Humulus lupulus]|uniref:uncharacterized protein LOC133832351 n=1 Tax=Humulus lupulus TaxID=3486 RepID=UPI002B40FFF0|nr:uncharacterized protein LOC133832351 [Humulus lupulus]